MKKVILKAIMSVTLLSVLIPVSSFSLDNSRGGQLAPNPIKKIVKALAKGNIFVLQEPAEASPLIISQQKNYTQLEMLATSYELEDLIKSHQNAVVRLYAFKALTHQVRDITESIMNIINSDGAALEYINGEKTVTSTVKQLAQHFLN